MLREVIAMTKQRMRDVWRCSRLHDRMIALRQKGQECKRAERAKVEPDRYGVSDRDKKVSIPWSPSLIGLSAMAVATESTCKTLGVV